MLTFRLVYANAIPSEQGKQDGRSDIKQLVRKEFGIRLRQVWRRDPFLQNIAAVGIPTVAKLKDEPVPDVPEPFFAVDAYGYKVIPLITWNNRLSCRLEVVFEDEMPSIMKRTADLDNRLKVVFDALRIPHVGGSSEVPGHMQGKNSEVLYCLLEDDELIKDCSIKAIDASGSPGQPRLTVDVTVYQSNWLIQAWSASVEYSSESVFSVSERTSPFAVLG